MLYALRHGGEAAFARQAERLSEFSARQLESLNCRPEAARRRRKLAAYPRGAAPMTRADNQKIIADIKAMLIEDGRRNGSGFSSH